MVVGAGIGVMGVLFLLQDINTKLSKAVAKNNFMVKVEVVRL